ncbi:hypothetical protein [Leptospira venezuelensis]|uniref:hypothetical protein n=1 Tax=Leptospira venezuelensis TaxID=1958811 RepID=UPI000A3BFDCA
MIRNQEVGPIGDQIDLGSLAEALLYYGEVRILAKHHVLEELIRKIGPDSLIRLLETGIFKLIYELDMMGIHTNASGTPNALHSPVVFHALKHEPDVALPELFHSVTGRSGKGRRLSKKFASLIETVNREPGLIEAFNSDIDNGEYIKKTVTELISIYAPEYTIPRSFIFDIDKRGNEFKIVTNLDFEELNIIYHQRISPKHSSITDAYIMSHILTARENAMLCAKYKSDIFIDSVNMRMLELCFDSIIQRTKHSKKNIETFQDFVFDDSRAVREAVNSGKLEFTEVINLVEKSIKFKEWVSERPSDMELVKEYFKEVTKTSSIDKLPTKIAKWSFFTGAGLAIGATLGSGAIGTGLGVLTSVVDAFVFDNIVKGWKPSSFINTVKSALVK